MFFLKKAKDTYKSHLTILPEVMSASRNVCPALSRQGPCASETFHEHPSWWYLLLVRRDIFAKCLIHVANTYWEFIMCQSLWLTSRTQRWMADRCSAQSYTKSELRDELDQFPDSMGSCGKATHSSETSGLAFLLSL